MLEYPEVKRRPFLVELNKALRTAREKSKTVGLVVIDITNLARINSQYGHNAGDIVLATVQDRLDSASTETNIVWRIASHHFAFILPMLKNSALIALAAKKLGSVLNDPVKVETKRGVATVKTVEQRAIQTHSDRKLKVLERILESDPDETFIVFCNTKRMVREVDRELWATNHSVSAPMFLGGLTARAIKLQSLWEKDGLQCFETYPGHTSKTLGLSDLGYKKEKENLPVALQKIAEKHTHLQWPEVNNWHAFDALLALLAALQYQAGAHSTVGDPEEGLIFLV